MRYIFSRTIIACVFFILIAASFAQAGDYVIGEGDKLQISVWGVDRLNFDVKVRPDGMITVPGLGDVTASGLKPEKLTKVLTGLLKELVKNPIVTVTVSDITNTKVFIFGNGTKSGIFDINRRTTLLQILVTLGEVRTADLKRAYLLRNNLKVKENFHALFIDGDMSEDIPIEVNDVIYIPAYPDKSIYVMGGVNAPKAIDYRDNISVMQAILEAGGFTKFANQNDVTIIRTENGKEISIPIKAEKLLKGTDLSQNVKLKPGDFMVIEESIF
jgi:polysaccharide export outer membrane protein